MPYNDEKTLALLATSNSIDATAAAPHDNSIYTVPSGKQCILVKAISRVLDDYSNGGKTTDAVVNIGSNSTAFDNWQSAVTINLDAADVHDTLEEKSGAIPVFQPGDVITVRYTTASDATTENHVWYLLGFLFDDD